MKITPLQKAVNEFKPDTIRVKGEDAFLVGSKEYEKKKAWFIKGEFEIVPQIGVLTKELRCLALEKDINITINKPMITAQDAPAASTPEEKLEAEANKLFVCRLIHKSTGTPTSTIKLKRREIPKFIDHMVKEYGNRHNYGAVKSEFLVVRVSFEDQTIDIDEC